MEIYFPGIWRARGSSHLVVPGQKKAPAPVPNNPDAELFQNPYLQALTSSTATPRKRKRKRKPSVDTNCIEAADPPIDSRSSPTEEPPDRVSFFDCED